jgi:hypothetical protein
MRMFSPFRWRRRVRLGVNDRHLSWRERHWSGAIDRRRRRLIGLRRRKWRGANRRLESRRCRRGLDGRHNPGAGQDGPVAGVVVDCEDETNQAEGQGAQKHGSKPHVLGTLHPGIPYSVGVSLNAFMRPLLTHQGIDQAITSRSVASHPSASGPSCPGVARAALEEQLSAGTLSCPSLPSLGQRLAPPLEQFWIGDLAPRPAHLGRRSSAPGLCSAVHGAADSALDGPEGALRSPRSRRSISARSRSSK